MKNLILLPVFLFFLSQDLTAQNINGFQIFVSKKQFTSIEFHSAIDNFAFAQKNPPYKIISMGAKTIFLETSQDVKAPYDLSVIEGGRIHKFVIIYSDEVDQSKRDNDYSNLTQLKTLIKSFVPVAISSSTQDNPKKNTSQDNSNKVSDNNQKSLGAVSSTSPANLNFYILIDEADKARKAGQWQIAKTKYKQALQIQPDNSYAQAQLQAVNEAIQNELETKYNDAITKARQAVAGNNYDNAIKNFSLALEAKPGDQYAINQIAELQKKAATAQIEKDNLQKEGLFDSYIRAGDKALSDKTYEVATTAYTEALKLRPNDSRAVLKLKSVSTQRAADSIAALQQKKAELFASFVNAGDKAFKEKDYEAARLSFNEAQKLKPDDAQIKLKLSDVRQAIYTGFCNAGDEALNRKSYDEAKDAYNEALKLKPGDVIALTKLKAVDKQKALDEAEDKFKNYVNTGDKAIGEKSYQIAAVAYAEALKIKPGDASVKTKLNSISQMVMADSLEYKRKQNEDLYQGFIASGSKALNARSFDEAKVAYGQALKIKPDDVFATQKIDLINQELYVNFLKQGDTALDNKQYNRAADAYNEALKIKPNDVAAHDKLAQIEKSKAQDKINDTYISYMNAGDKATGNKSYDEARVSYKEALKTKPGDSAAMVKITQLNQKIETDSLAAVRLKSDTAFMSFINAANEAINKKDYNTAIFSYTEALKIKPGNEYAMTQVSKVQQAIIQAQADSIKQEEGLYDSYVRAGDKALSDKTYEVATTAYTEALKLRPNDSRAVLKLKSVSTQRAADSIAALQQKKAELFESFVNAGDKAFKEKDYESARLSFNEAQKLKPDDAQIKLKLNDVRQAIYTGFCNAGDEALNRKSYDEAKDAYNEALKLKPGDVIALTKLKAVDKQKALDEADDKFKNYVNTGDKAIGEKSYQIATVAYTEALKIKPGDASVKAKLNSVSQMVIADSLEYKRKQNEDLYQGFIASGSKALNARSFDEAKVAYGQALKIKPDDVFATQKIDLINQELYVNFLKQGDTALDNKQYNRAADAYNEALKIKPNDVAAHGKLAQIEKSKVQDKINDTYISYMNAGDKATGNKSYDEARISYKEALKTKPGDSAAMVKITQLNQKIETDSLAAVRLKSDTAFMSFINAANEAINKKDYNTAIFSYTEALKIKPGNEYAMTQVSKVQQAIIQAQTDSIKQKEEKHEVAANNNEQVADSMKAGAELSPVDLETLAVNEIEKGMLLIKARYFKMGSDVGSTDESPMHPVKLDSFYFSRFEVTQSQWQSIMGNNPSFFKNCDDCPVENVSWYDAMKFIERLNQITHKNYRLPTEAEWEYVAGTQNRKEDIDNIAWYNYNARSKTHHIGLLQPDFLGVYDMFGNVAEWCSDWYSYSTYRKNLTVNPIGPANGREKVVRGGSWYDMGGSFRTSVRDKASPDKASKKTGFRLAMSLN